MWNGTHKLTGFVQKPNGERKNHGFTQTQNTSKPNTDLQAMATSIAIFFLLLYFSATFCVCEYEIWHLNRSHTVHFQELEREAWRPQHYPATLVFPFYTFEFPDVSICPCFLRSPSFSFTFSLYMYPKHSELSGAIIWTANRENPIKGSSASLTLRSDGNLVLFGEDPNSPVWSTNTSHQGVASMEVTQHPVSLTLYTQNRSVVWQSADYPTDTLTMFQYLHTNKKLVSWVSPSDPSLGAYSLVMEPGGLALYTNMLNNSLPYWIWGFFGLNDTFSVQHTCTPVSAFMSPEGALWMNTSDVSVEADNSSYWPSFCHLQPGSGMLQFQQYGLGNSASVLNTTILRLEHDGNLRVYTLASAWSTQLNIFGADSCLLPNVCGPYGICSSGSQCNCPANIELFHPFDSSRVSLGCTPSKNLTCLTNESAQAETGMLQLSGLDYFPNIFSTPANISTKESCAADCLHDCSCLAAFWHVHSQTCFHVQDYVGSLRSVSNQSNYIAFLKVGIRNGNTQSRKKFIVFVGMLVLGLIGLVVLIFFTPFLWCKKECYKTQMEVEDGKDNSFIDGILGLPTKFSYDELVRVTDGFAKKLGKGASGSVYAGVLSDGTKVAVKRIEGIRQGDKEFRAELAVMGGIHHHNLLRLIGFCANKGERLLVYEYMDNDSLDQWLFDKADKKSQLTWERRYKIALGTAQGLAYLHEGCWEKIIHMDIKPQNILLDENFDAKVADFGLSRLVGRDETEVMTTMRGTPGYLAPEWIKRGTIDEKCDVYSFGMLLMEIISGRKNLDCHVETIEQIYFPEWAFWEAQKMDVSKLSDAILETDKEAMQLKRMINTAFLCVVEDSALRPSMSKVVQMLQGDVPLDKFVLSHLHHGLLFVLKNPSSFADLAKVGIEEAFHHLVIGTVPKSLPR